MYYSSLQHAQVVPLKDKKGATIFSAFQSISNNQKRKTNKLSVDQDSKFSFNAFKTQLNDNNIEIYLTHIERRSVVLERFMRTLKIRTYNRMTALPKKVYDNVLNEIVDK